jgi:hypothetical protein
LHSNGGKVVLVDTISHVSTENLDRGTMAPAKRTWGREAWLVVLGSLLAGVPTLLGVFITGSLTNAGEASAFIRDKRLAVYAGFDASLTQLEASSRTVALAYEMPASLFDQPYTSRPEPPASELQELTLAYSNLQIIGSRPAVESARLVLERQQEYQRFLASAVGELTNDRRSSSGWLDEKSSQLLAAAGDCLSNENHASFLNAVQLDIGVDATSVPTTAPICAELDWTSLSRTYIDWALNGMPFTN